MCLEFLRRLVFKLVVVESTLDYIKKGDVPAFDTSLYQDQAAVELRPDLAENLIKERDRRLLEEEFKGQSMQKRTEAQQQKKD